MSGSGGWRWERLPGCWGMGVYAGWRVLRGWRSRRGRAVRASWAVSRPTGYGRGVRAPRGCAGSPFAGEVAPPPEAGRRAAPPGAPGGRGHGGRAAPRPRGSPWEGTSRTTEGARHPDRDAQFRYLNGQVKEFTAAGQPQISVDTKKKEVL